MGPGFHISNRRNNPNPANAQTHVHGIASTPARRAFPRLEGHECEHAKKTHGHGNDFIEHHFARIFAIEDAFGFAADPTESGTKAAQPAR